MPVSPLAITPLDRSGGEALYEQLADRLRHDIQGGRYGPGVALPSERRLRAAYGVTRSTVRSAVGVLRAEGLVTAEQGAGAFVREPTARTVLTAGTPPRPGQAPRLRPGARAFRTGAGAHHVEVRRVEAAHEWAERLGVPEGTEVCVRTSSSGGADGTDLIVTTVVPWALAKGTALARPSPLPAGEAAVLKGTSPVTVSSDWVEARMPSPLERRALRMEEGVPVMKITRVWQAETRVVGFRTTLAPADRTVLQYEVPLDPS